MHLRLYDSSTDGGSVGGFCDVPLDAILIYGGCPTDNVEVVLRRGSTTILSFTVMRHLKFSN